MFGGKRLSGFSWCFVHYIITYIIIVIIEKGEEKYSTFKSLSEISNYDEWNVEGLQISPFFWLFLTFLSGKFPKRGCEG